MTTPDIRIEHHGSIIVFQPLTDAARDWIDEHVQTEPYQWMGTGLCVETRYAGDLASGMQDAGLQIE